MLNSDSPVPLYRQLADILSEDIRAGRYVVGERIPSEHALCRQYGIGRPTVRQATDLLVRKRVLQRRRGSGTFVREAPPLVDLFTLAGTMHSFEQSGIAVEPELLTPLNEVLVEAEDSGLNPFVGHGALHFERLSRVRRRPVLLERFYLHLDLFRGLVGEDLAVEGLSTLVRERLHLTPRAADQYFDIAEVSGDRARALGLSAGASVLRVRRQIHFAAVERAVFVELYCRTDRLVFSQTIPGLDHA